MKTAKVRGADGTVVDLGFVRADGAHAHMCPLSKVGDVEAGDESSVVVFPIADVQIAPEQCKAGHV